MSLATQALNPIALDPAFLTCHMATWFWAATEANPAKQILVRAGNIGVIVPSTQQGMLNLPRSGMWERLIFCKKEAKNFRFCGRWHASATARNKQKFFCFFFFKKRSACFL
jgi:hypothetical protein